MTVAITFQKTPKTKADTAVLPVGGGGLLSPAGKAIDEGCGGFIAHHLKKQKKFSGKQGQILVLSAPKESPYRNFVLLGVGDSGKIDALACETLGGKLFSTLAGNEAGRAVFFADMAMKAVTGTEGAAHLALGVRLRSYRFDKYKSADPEQEGAADSLKGLEVVTPDAAKAAKAFAGLEAAAAGVFLARDLVNEPPNLLYPDSFAKIIKRELSPLGVEVQIFDEKKMQALGFNAALAVGMGSARPPRIVVMRWNGTKEDPDGKPAKGKKAQAGPLAFVGKGVTFDTGGVNLKPSGSIEEMKLDMGGAAAVVGLMKSLALRKAKVHVVGIAGLAENMPSDKAYRPSDIIQSLSGKTIEVMNTDAEGRLVLADCLTYVQKTYKPRLVIDLATLTGAMMMALGYDYCGTFVNHDDLWARLEKASKHTGEKLWRMPLDEVFKKDMVGKISDLQSLGTMGRYAGACTAAGFLEHFIEEGRPWAHLDIAGTAWIKADRATCPKPATGFGVRVLDRFIAENYE